MNKIQILDCIRTERIVAIIRLPDLSQAQPLVEALLSGGIRVVEFTLTNPQAFDVVYELRQKLPVFDAGEAVIGIGSIRTGDEASRAIDAGAQLLVAPTLLREMITIGQAADVVTAPAGFTPTEIDMAQSLGADVVKVFPANVLGVSFIKGIKAAMPDLNVLPTGGINLKNINDYLAAGVTAVGIGASLIQSDLIDAGDWQGLENLAQQYVSAIGGSHEP